MCTLCTFSLWFYLVFLLIAVYLQVKQHRKDPQLLPVIKKFFAYKLETHSRKYPDETIVLLFDLAGAGLAHLVSSVLFIDKYLKVFTEYWLVGNFTMYWRNLKTIKCKMKENERALKNTLENFKYFSSLMLHNLLSYWIK